MKTDFLETIKTGQVISSSGRTQVKELPWHEHPTFQGVSLKHLITGKGTDGNFSSHLVRVKSGCEIGEHIHEGKWELHEIIGGRGKCLLAGKEIEYAEGFSTIIPADTAHIVQAAGDDDLYILAKFFPALL